MEIVEIAGLELGFQKIWLPGLKIGWELVGFPRLGLRLQRIGLPGLEIALTAGKAPQAKVRVLKGKGLQATDSSGSPTSSRPTIRDTNNRDPWARNRSGICRVAQATVRIPKSGFPGLEIGL